MGRYSSVQAYADNNTSVSRISYDQATSGGGGGNNNSGSSGGPQPVVTEKVSNPYGSTAGAGSGEFHVYRHARAREAARWKELDAKLQEQERENQFRQQLEEARKEEEEKTAKRRKKRQREKEAKQRKKILKAAGIAVNASNQDNNHNDEDDDEEGPIAPKAPQQEEEFSYIPVAQQQQEDIDNNSKNDTVDLQKPASGDENAVRTGEKQGSLAAAQPAELPNDGSFLERMKQMMEQQQHTLVQEDSERTNQEQKATSYPSRVRMESRIIDEDDDDEGPMLPPAFLPQQK